MKQKFKRTIIVGFKSCEKDSMIMQNTSNGDIEPSSSKNYSGNESLMLLAEENSFRERVSLNFLIFPFL